MIRWPTIAVIAGLMVSACVGGDADPPATTAGTVEIFGPFRGEEAELLAASLEGFEESTGIEIRYTGTGSFVGDLEAQVRAVDPPDIALVPQPGLVAELTRSGDIMALGSAAFDAVEDNYDEQTRVLGEVDGTLVGVPFQVSLKSLVWYRPDVFEKLELEIPRTLAELDSMAQRLQDDGIAPWCFGLEAQGATGWVATDWTEEMVLRLAGTGIYDGWVDGDVEFTDEAIAEAFDQFRQLVLSPGRSAGGISGVLRTPHQVSPLGLLGDAPDCILHRQASFVFGLMPAGLEFGPDADIHFFVLPGLTAAEPPLLIGSTVAVAFDDRPEVDEVMAHLATPESTRLWAQAGGFLSPRTTSSPDDDLPPVDRAALDLILTADTIRPDASDAMAPEIGSGLLWREITDWVADTTTYEQFATTIDSARSETTR